MSKKGNRKATITTLVSPSSSPYRWPNLFSNKLHLGHLYTFNRGTSTPFDTEIRTGWLSVTRFTPFQRQMQKKRKCANSFFKQVVRQIHAQFSHTYAGESLDMIFSRRVHRSDPRKLLCMVYRQDEGIVERHGHKVFAVTR